MWRAFVLATLMLATAGCVSEPAPDTEPTPPPQSGGPFAITSAAFAQGADIPRRHTCDGENLSPPLNVTGAPAEAVALAIILGDPDVPTPQTPQRNFTHWTLWNVPLTAGAATFAEGAVPNGTVEGVHDGSGTGYTGPCPPLGSPAHRYMFTVFALDAPLDLAAGATRADLEKAIDGRVVAVTSFHGMYARAVVG